MRTILALNFLVMNVLAMTVVLPAAAGVIKINGEIPPYDVWHHTVMPGEAVRLTLPPAHVAVIDGTPTAPEWVAPGEAGYHQLVVKDEAGRAVSEISIFVLEPTGNIDQSGYLNGYRIGTYPKDTPAGLIELEKGVYDVPISPSLHIGQFLCKQQPDHFPKYLLVTQANIKRLELLLSQLRKDGATPADSFFVMSGYRTPYYNTAIGSAKYSRHMYGDAADIYLDVDPHDGVMDDVDGDGKITKADADFLYDYAQDLFASSTDVEPGGLGPYKANAVHGPFLHVDGRGRAARWGR